MAKDWKEKWVRGERLGAENTGQGNTFLARRVEGQEVEFRHVLKILKRQDDSERRTRMYREVAILRTLDHAGVARFVDSNAEHFEDRSFNLYLVTDLIPGSTVEALVTRFGPRTVSDASALMLRLLETLGHCHRQGVIHRDIKPGNVVLKQDKLDEPVLIDFGMSYNSEVGPDDFATDSDQHIGNRFIILPEYAGKGEDKRNALSDITQGVGLFFYLLTGIAPGHLRDQQDRQPHTRPHALEALKRVAAQQPRQLTRIFDVGFSQRMDSRWQSVEALTAEIERLPIQRAESSTFLDRIREIKQSADAQPEVSLRKRLAQLLPDIQGTWQAVATAAQNELGDEVQIVCQSVNPQSRRVHGSDHIFTIQLLWKHRQSKRIDLTGWLGISGTEFVLSAKIDNVEHEKKWRFGAFDPDPIPSIRSMIEEYIYSAIQQIFSQSNG